MSDARLRQVFPNDPRLTLANGGPQRELITSEDVDRINRDISRLQDQSKDRFPAQHADRAYFDAIRGKLSDSVSDTKVADVVLAAKRAGIENASDLGDVAMRNDRIFVTGKTPGFHTQLDARAPSPDMQDTVYKTDQHNAVKAYEQGNRPQTMGIGGR